MKNKNLLVMYKKVFIFTSNEKNLDEFGDGSE
jgi:hypothetical protein